MKAITAEKLTETRSPAAAPSIASRRLKIVADRAAESTTSIWEPLARQAGGVPTTDEVLHQTRPPELLAPEIERAIVAVLLRPLRADESHQIDNDNRERELCHLFARLAPIEAYHLRRRLDLDRADDEVAVAFRRLVVERRQRLRALLADPRRTLRL